jgi:hypothetical protein
MKSKFLCLWVVVQVCLVLLLASCHSVTVGRGQRHKPGPPPHAPAHGYRHNHEGWQLVYDSGRGVYVVIDLPNHFYYQDSFYRYEKPYWQVSARMGGPWRPVGSESLPPGLRAKEKEAPGPKQPRGRALGVRKNK